MTNRRTTITLLAVAAVALPAAGCGEDLQVNGGSKEPSPTLSVGEQAKLTANVSKLAGSLATVATDAGKCANPDEIRTKGIKAVNECASKALAGLSATVNSFRDDVTGLISKTTGPCKEGLTAVRGDLAKASDELSDVSGEVAEGELTPFVSTTGRLAPVLAKIQGDLGSTLSACRR